MRNTIMHVGAAFFIGTILGWIMNSNLGTVSSEDLTPDESKSRRLDQTPSSDSRISNLSPTCTSLFSTLLSKDFEALARDAALSSDPRENSAYLLVIMSEWAKKDPMGAITLAQEIKRPDLIYEGLRHLAQQDPQHALSWISQNGESETQERYLAGAVYEGWAKVSPEEAINHLTKNSADPSYHQMLATILDVWAQDDISGAFEWLRSSEIATESDEAFNATFNRVMSRYIDQDLEGAATFILTMEDSQEKANLASRVAMQMARKDEASALEWLKNFEDERARNSALLGIVDRWSSGPRAKQALEYLMTNPGKEGQNRALETVVANLANSHPETLLELFPDMRQEDQIVTAKQLGAVLSHGDTDEFQGWVRDLEASAVKDSAINGALGRLGNSDPQKAFLVSAMLSDNSQRLAHLERTLTVWTMRDAGAAAAALNDLTNLSASEKEILLNNVQAKVGQLPNDQ